MKKAVMGTMDEPFFTKNFELKYVPEFKELIEEEGEEKAGKIMWAIWMMEDPDSQIYKMEHSVKEQAAKDYLAFKIVWVKYDKYIEAYKTHTMSEKKRQYMDYLEMMKKRHEYLMSLEYNGTNAETVDKLMINSKKIWDELNKIEKEYLTENARGSRAYGGRVESALETGKI